MSLETRTPASFSNGTSDGLEIVSQIFEGSCENEMNVAARKATVSVKDLKVYISVRFVVCLFLLTQICNTISDTETKSVKPITKYTTTLLSH